MASFTRVCILLLMMSTGKIHVDGEMFQFYLDILDMMDPSWISSKHDSVRSKIECASLCYRDKGFCSYFGYKGSTCYLLKDSVNRDTCSQYDCLSSGMKVYKWKQEITTTEEDYKETSTTTSSTTPAATTTATRAATTTTTPATTTTSGQETTTTTTPSTTTTETTVKTEGTTTTATTTEGITTTTEDTTTSTEDTTTSTEGTTTSTEDTTTSTEGTTTSTEDTTTTTEGTTTTTKGTTTSTQGTTEGTTTTTTVAPTTTTESTTTPTTTTEAPTTTTTETTSTTEATTTTTEAISTTTEGWNCDPPEGVEGGASCEHVDFLPNAMGTKGAFLGDALTGYCTNMYEQVYADEEEIHVFFTLDGGLTLNSKCPDSYHVIHKFKLCVKEALPTAIILHCRLLKDPDKIENHYDVTSNEVNNLVNCSDQSAIQSINFRKESVLTRIDFACIKINATELSAPVDAPDTGTADTGTADTDAADTGTADTDAADTGDVG